MRNAIYTAIDITGHRRAWAAWTANPLPHAERERGHRDNPGRETGRAEREE